MISIDEKQLEIILENAADKGAQRALHRVGLHDENAGKDIDDLRSLLTAWREACKTVRSTVIRIVITAVLGAVLVALGWNYWPQK